MPLGATRGLDDDADRLRASARADSARVIANCTDAANGSLAAPRAAADESAVSHALGYGVAMQMAVTFTLDAAAAAEAAILGTTATLSFAAAVSPWLAATAATGVAPPSRHCNGTPPCKDGHSPPPPKRFHVLSLMRV
jgi:hypothetical protein